mgnify:FL=1
MLGPTRMDYPGTIASVAAVAKYIGEVLAELGDHESPPKSMWEAASKRWMDDINQRIALLENMRDMIGSCVGCGCLSLGECHLLNPGDELNKLGPGPRRLLTEQ